MRVFLIVGTRDPCAPKCLSEIAFTVVCFSDRLLYEEVASVTQYIAHGSPQEGCREVRKAVFRDESSIVPPRGWLVTN
jgi:hypothetical protein